jgi:two-component system, NtrC family, sensor histidine kinase PilS
MPGEVFTLMGLTAVLAALVAVLVFAMLRFAAAARRMRRGARGQHGELLATAVMEEALGRLRDQERQLAARAEASERLSEEIVAGIGSGLMLVGHDGLVRLVNPAGLRLLRLAALDVPERPYEQTLAGVPPLAEAIRECLAEQRPIVRRTVEVRDAGLDGITHLGVTVSPVFLRAQALQAVVCVFTDLTAVAAAEEQHRVKEGLARLGELTAGLAHEFRNGLATIHGYARMLNPDALPPAQATCVEGIRQETQALGEVVTNFLSFARPAPMSLARVDVGGLLDRVAADAAHEARLLGGDVVLRGEFGWVEGEEVLLRQAFSNVCRNAIEASTGAARPPQVVVEGSIDRGRNLLRVVVRDNGPGIAPEATGRLFQPFFTTKPAGTGLGLAIVQKVVVTHNGRVEVRNGPEGGAVVEVQLPWVPGAPRRGRQAAGQPAG